MRTGCRASAGPRGMRATPLLAALLLVVAIGCGGRQRRPTLEEPASSLPAAPRSIAAGCDRVAERSAFPVLCPVTWPPHRGPGRPELRVFANAPDAYLIDVSNGFSRRGPHVFHVLLGGQSRPVGPGLTGVEPALRVTTRRATIPMKGGGKFVQTRPARRIGSATVHGNRAAVLKEPPYPQGGLHGGHVVILWNQDGHAYLVSAHGARMPQRDIVSVALQIARSARRG
jgi:hypothetical protein